MNLKDKIMKLMLPSRRFMDRKFRESINTIKQQNIKVDEKIQSVFYKMEEYERNNVDRYLSIISELKEVQEKYKVTKEQTNVLEDLIQMLLEIEKQAKEMYDVKFIELQHENENLRRDIERLNQKADYLKNYIINPLYYCDYYYMKPKFYKEELEHWYRIKTCKKLDLDNPQTYNEKVQWLKLYDSTKEKTMLADKYLFRDFIREKFGEQYLIPLLGVWDSFEEIDFEKLPDRFVLKMNHGSGMNIIVTDKEKMDIDKVRQKITEWSQINYAFRSGFEMHYKNICHKIIAEQYIPYEYEYQFWCFNGKIEFISVVHQPHGENKKASFDLEWNQLDFVTSLPRMDSLPKKPILLSEMKKIAQDICKDFKHVRVDFYADDNTIRVGEITFTPASGLVKWYPADMDYIMGEKLVIEEQYNT